MARSKKPKALKLGNDLRIPVTPEQRRVIMEAVADEPNGFAAWARVVLVEAAMKKLDKKQQK